MKDVGRERRKEREHTIARPGLAMTLSLFSFISELDVSLSLSRFFPPPTCRLLALRLILDMLLAHLEFVFAPSYACSCSTTSDDGKGARILKCAMRMSWFIWVEMRTWVRRSLGNEQTGYCCGAEKVCTEVLGLAGQNVLVLELINVNGKLRRHASGRGKMKRILRNAPTHAVQSRTTPCRRLIPSSFRPHFRQTTRRP